MAEYIVLSVDDDQSARMLFEIMLKRSGFEFIAAEDADEALEILANTTPDLILSDIQLPGMNGIELVAELRKRTELDKTAIVVLSAFQSDTKVEDAFTAGADEFFKKPLKMAGLAEQLIKLIQKRREE